MESPEAIIPGTRGAPLLVSVPTCCVYAITDGRIDVLVRRELITGTAVADGWLYVATAEQTDHPGAISRVALDGAKHETLLAFGTNDGPLMLAVAGSFVYAVTAHSDPQTLNFSDVRLHRIPIAGGAETSVALQVPVTALAVRGDRALLASRSEIYEIRDLALTRIAVSSDAISALASNGTDVYVGALGGIHHLTPKNELELFATVQTLRAIAASATHVAWIDGDNVMVEPVAGGTPKQIPTLKQEPGAVAIDGSAVYWSVPYYYVSEAKTTEERLRAQRAGFVARSLL
jgi:hypothetical protein